MGRRVGPSDQSATERFNHEVKVVTEGGTFRTSIKPRDITGRETLFPVLAAAALVMAVSIWLRPGAMVTMTALVITWVVVDTGVAHVLRRATEQERWSDSVVELLENRGADSLRRGLIGERLSTSRIRTSLSGSWSQRILYSVNGRPMSADITREPSGTTLVRTGSALSSE